MIVAAHGGGDDRRLLRAVAIAGPEGIPSRGAARIAAVPIRRARYVLGGLAHRGLVRRRQDANTGLIHWSATDAGAHVLERER